MVGPIAGYRIDDEQSAGVPALFRNLSSAAISSSCGWGMINIRTCDNRFAQSTSENAP
jgi:hypothetical protein